MVPLAQRYDLALLPWSPLAGGILAGRYNKLEAPAPPSSRLERSGEESLCCQRLQQQQSMDEDSHSRLTGPGVSPRVPS